MAVLAGDNSNERTLVAKIVGEMVPFIHDQATKDRAIRAVRARSCAVVAMDNQMAAQITKLIAKERSTPSGVVDLVQLHSMGDALQADRDDAAAEKAWYAHQGIGPLLCK